MSTTRIAGEAPALIGLLAASKPSPKLPMSRPVITFSHGLGSTMLSSRLQRIRLRGPFGRAVINVHPDRQGRNVVLVTAPGWGRAMLPNRT
jgi:hypothetical protein